MRVPIDLDDSFAVKEREVREVLMLQERMLDTVAFSEGCECWLQGNLSRCHLVVEPVPVSKKHREVSPLCAPCGN